LDVIYVTGYRTHAVLDLDHVIESKPTIQTQRNLILQYHQYMY